MDAKRTLPDRSELFAKLGEEAYDAILSDQAFEHLHPDDHLTHVTEARKVLRPGGFARAASLDGIARPLGDFRARRRRFFAFVRAEPQDRAFAAPAGGVRSRRGGPRLAPISFRRRIVFVYGLPNSDRTPRGARRGDAGRTAAVPQARQRALRERLDPDRRRKVARRFARERIPQELTGVRDQNLLNGISWP